MCDMDLHCKEHKSALISNLQSLIYCIVFNILCVSNLQKQDDPCVGHGIRKSQNSTSHDGIAQVEDRHPK